MKRAITMLVLVGGCSVPASDVSLSIRQPTDRSLLTSVDHLLLHADRDDRTIAEAQFPPTVDRVGLSGVSYGPRTVFSLDGVTTTGDIVAHGSTCTLDFEKARQSASLYFAPTHLFAPTPGAPPTVRSEQVSIVLDDGDVLLLGGLEDGHAVLGATRYVESSATFVDAPEAALGSPRADAQISQVSSIGWLITGGVDDTGVALSSAELYFNETALLVPIDNEALGARTQHRATVLSNDRVLLTGGVGGNGGVETLATTSIVSVQADGSAQVSVGPPLQHARSEHAVVTAVGTPVLVGGLDATHQPLASIEALGFSEDGALEGWQEIAELSYARADATATLLEDGSILVVGGIGSDGNPRADAEVVNPITRTTVVYSLAAARSGHTATILGDGRVLVVGGFDSVGKPLSSTELFVPNVGFVSELPLVLGRSGHMAVPLCDGTVLIVGGAADAELYTPSAD